MKLRGIVAGALALGITLFCATTFAQVNPGTSPLTGAKGGTNNAFMQFAGPATSLKTFTVPNASSTLAALGAIQTWTAVQTFNDATVVLLGSTSLTNIGAPSSPASGSVKIWSDSTDLRLHDKNSAGTIGTTVVSSTAPANQFASSISAAGAVGYSQPSVSNLSGFGTGVATALGVNVGSAGAFVTFNGALGTPSSATLTNATGLPISTGVSGLGTSVATVLANTASGAGGPAVTIASGATAMGTGAISSATCATVVTATATNTLTTDAIIASFNGDPTAVTGYVPSTNGMLTIIVYPTANNANFKVCNNTGASVTPGAITLNWRVVR